MKNTKEIKELKDMDDKALYKELLDMNKKMTELSFKVNFRKLKNFHEITNTRKRIARIWTILNARILEKIEKEAK
jgi:ribosomal protein L29